MGRHEPDVQGLLKELVERQRLLEKLSKIQASISHRQPLQDVLDAITQGAADLLGDEVVGLRLADPDDPGYVIVVSSVGLDPQSFEAIERTPAEQGAGGKAMVENRLVVIESYSESTQGLTFFRERELQAAMAAPVREKDRAIGSLVVASYRPGRTFSESEKEALMSFATHASLALSDARTVEQMREAQRDRDMFLAMVSHELKTPLTVIMGALQAIESRIDDIDTERARRMLASASERGRELSRMIDLLLEGASSAVSEDIRDVTPAELLVDATTGFDHSLRIQMEPAPDATCRVDLVVVRRILGILLENALSHSPMTSQIRIGADVDDGRLLLWVENEGALPSDVDSVFEPFRRGEGVRSSGVGLGLHIAQRIAQGSGGRLTASAADGIVRFQLDLPIVAEVQPLQDAAEDPVVVEDA